MALPNSPDATVQVHRALCRLALATGRHETALAAAGRVSSIELRAILDVDLAGGLTPTELATRLSLSSGGMTALVQRVEHRGWLGRSSHPTDGRSVIIELTREGRARLADLLA